MHFSHLLSIALRIAQLISSAVVLSLSAYFLHQRSQNPSAGPFARLIYTVVIAAISVWLSLLWIFLPHATLVHFITDLILCAAWFAVFGVLQDWFDDALRCGSSWDWGNIGLSGGTCGMWNAAQAFTFLSAVFWFASFLVGVLAFSHLRGERARAADPEVGTAR